MIYHATAPESNPSLKLRCPGACAKVDRIIDQVCQALALLLHPKRALDIGGASGDVIEGVIHVADGQGAERFVHYMHAPTRRLIPEVLPPEIVMFPARSG